MDREARDPFELLDEISDQLQLETAPMEWPVGMGLNFKGVLDLTSDQFVPFSSNDRVDHASLSKVLSADLKARLDEDVALVRAGLPAFDLATYREGHQSPVFFGSALKNFGVSELLHALAAYAPPPREQAALGRAVEPSDKEVTGFVFKVQANMDPNHRDRVAFLRLASGEFRRNMKLKQSGTGKSIGVHNPIHCSSPPSARRWMKLGPATLSAFPITACCGSATRCRNRAAWCSPAFPISRRRFCAGCAWPIR